MDGCGIEIFDPCQNSPVTDLLRLAGRNALVIVDGIKPVGIEFLGKLPGLSAEGLQVRLPEIIARLHIGICIIGNLAVLVYRIGKTAICDMVRFFIIIIHISRIAAVHKCLTAKRDSPVSDIIGKRSHAHFIDLRFFGGQIKYNT